MITIFFHCWVAGSCAWDGEKRRKLSCQSPGHFPTESLLIYHLCSFRRRWEKKKESLSRNWRTATWPTELMTFCSCLFPFITAGARKKGRTNRHETMMRKVLHEYYASECWRMMNGKRTFRVIFMISIFICFIFARSVSCGVNRDMTFFAIYSAACQD